MNSIYFDILGKELKVDEEPSVSHDGQPFAICHVYFLVQVDMEKVLKKLLSLPHTKKNHLEKKRDKQGRLQWSRFYLFAQDSKQPKKREPVYKGEITLYRKKLKIAVTSKALAEELRALMELRLGPCVTYQKTQVISDESRYTPIYSFLRKYQGVEVHIEDYPTFEAYWESLGKIHWTYWLDQPEFALDGLTAREAAQTEAGRVQLKALLRRFKNRNKRRPPDLTNLPVNFVKEQLGIH